MSTELFPQEGDDVADRSIRVGSSAADSRYERREAIDAGGMGEVWVAYDSVLEQIVALKRLHRYFENRPDIISELKREVEAGRRIYSPNVVRVYDFAYVDRYHCVVMEYVKGNNLKELCRDQNLSPAALSQVILQMCSGLAAIHDAGFAHGDLRPENVLVDQSGRVVIVDLGRATEIAEDTFTRSPGFLAPELISSPSSKRSDVYAFGQMVLFLLRGRSGDAQSEPFAGLPWLKPIVYKCIAADPNERYPSAQEVSQHLETTPLHHYRAERRKKAKWLSIASALTASLAIFFFVARMIHAPGATHQDGVRAVVTPLDENPLSRMLADIVGVYLETEHFAVSRPPHHIQPQAALTGRGDMVPSVAISASMTVVDGVPSAHLKIDKVAAQTREFQIRSDHTIFDSLTAISNEIRLSRPRPEFEVPITDSAQLVKLAESWQKLNHSAVDFPQLKGQNVLGLLLDARLYTHLQSVTGSQKYLRLAKIALDQLDKTGIAISETVLMRSFIAQREGDSRLSVEILKSGLKALPTTAAMHRELADLQLAAGFANEAIISGNTAVRLDPFSLENYKTAATAYSAVWQEQSAADLLARASELDPSNGDTYLRLGIVYLRLGKFELARKALERNVELKPTESGTMYLGLSNLLCGNNAQALLLLEGVVAEHKSLRSLSTLGAALRWLGRSDSARSRLEEARRLGNESSFDVSELGVLAMVNAQLGNIQKADMLIVKAGGRDLSSNIELLYDSMIVDAFAKRNKACNEKFHMLQRRRFPIVFAQRDPQVLTALKDE